VRFFSYCASVENIVQAVVSSLPHSDQMPGNQEIPSNRYLVEPYDANVLSETNSSTAAALLV
jgi:hypothetical protein